MQKQLLFVFLFVAVCDVFAYPILENEYGEQYYLVPVGHLRIRRQTRIGVSRTGYRFSHTGNIINNSKHRLDGTAFGSKPFRGPLTVGGNLDYSHIPTGNRLSIGATHTRGHGTDVTAQGRFNVYRSPNGRTSADLSGQFSKHFGGPQGTGRSSYGAFLHFRHRF